MGIDQTGASRHRVLIAARPVVLDALQELFEPTLFVHSADSLESALRTLGSRVKVELIICTIQFDESRMFDLLRVAKARYPDIPFVCCRVLDSDAPRISLEALRIASEALGAVAFLDLPGLAKTYGKAGMQERFLAAILGHLSS